MTKVIVDAFGGDYSPEEIIKGAGEALKDNTELEIVLVGEPNRVGELMTEYNVDKSRVEIIEANEIITNDEAPTVAIRTKKDSTIVKAFDALRTREDITGLVSAGSTGAVLTRAFLKLGRLPNERRPALCT